MFRSLRISHVEFRFPGSEKLGPSRNGWMERNFPVIPIFRNFRPIPRGTFRKEIPENVCSIRSPAWNFRNFWSNEKRPIPTFIARSELSHMSPSLPIWLANYKRASRLGERLVLFKFRSQNGSFRYAFTVIEFFSSSLEFWFFGIEIFLPLFLLFILEFHNIFATGILRRVTTSIAPFCCIENE